jgi:hypothetical protein
VESITHVLKEFGSLLGLVANPNKSTNFLSQPSPCFQAEYSGLYSSQGGSLVHAVSWSSIAVQEKVSAIINSWLSKKLACSFVYFLCTRVAPLCAF